MKKNISLFYRFARVVCTLAMRFWFRLKIVGLENLPQDGGYLLVSNHRSYLDPVMIGLRIQRELRFMAKAELFRNRLLSALIRKLGAFPVSRGTGDTSALDTAIQVVERGGVLILYPEGTRSRTGELLRFKSGAVVIAAQSGATIVPAALYYERGARFRSRVIVRYGTPIPNEALAVDLEQPRTIKAAGHLVRDAVAELLEQSRQEGA